MMAKEELFKFKPLGWIFKKVGAFPIARGKKDFGHVFHAVNVVTKENMPGHTDDDRINAWHFKDDGNATGWRKHSSNALGLHGKTKAENGKKTIISFTVNMKEKTKKWLKAAGIRALKTAAQTAAAAIGVSAMIEDVNWLAVGSTALLAAILSLLTSLGGLPELDNN